MRLLIQLHWLVDRIITLRLADHVVDMVRIINLIMLCGNITDLVTPYDLWSSKYVSAEWSVSLTLSCLQLNLCIPTGP